MLNKILQTISRYIGRCKRQESQKMKEWKKCWTNLDTAIPSPFELEIKERFSQYQETRK